MKNHSMKIIPLVIFAVPAAFFLLFFYGPKKAPQEVKSLMKTFITAQQNLDLQALKKMYAGNATIQIEKVTANGQLIKSYEIGAHQAVKHHLKTNRMAKQYGEYESYTDIEYDGGGDNVQVSSVHYSPVTDKITPHMLVLVKRKSFDITKGMKIEWLITNEYIIEYAN